MTAAPQIRNDGKPQRASRIVRPKRRPPSTLRHGETAASWHELIAPGPKGDPGRTHQRRAERGQVTPYTGQLLDPPPAPSRQGGPVRLGLGRLGGRAKGAPIPGARESMLAIRERPRDRRRAAARRARTAQS